ncbi:outer membrane beta-barrel protein [Helicobacter cappadocius]|uniref:Outer membrane beta-barrel protein n=1 Tax=Helicobacter cappadocius TaxID=3063998 RepID=A0AA90TF43_9HELI|nr:MULTISPECIES: outer membrane beta-barrel protein [unclassified Helicobacter]MDO7253330.1 outer membrane beta-barrel protein [Helicobacter sp. faydin-H75]MDP2539240.1 outer membrane beta-barrel protein [Helicobacter sp. faydin-H76]
MKKNLLAILLVLSSLTSLANARFFLGIDGGYSMDKVDVKTEDKTTYTGTNTIVTPGSFTKNAYLGNGYLFDINLGTEHHFDKNNYVGFRWFLAGGYGRTTLVNQSNNLIKYPSSIIGANLGLDLLLDAIKVRKQ